MKNMWIEIAKEAGVEIDEVFKMEALNGCDICAGDYKINKNGLLHMNEADVWINSNFEGRFISGDFEVIKKAFIPKSGDDYFYVDFSGVINRSTCYRCTIDLYTMEHGNFYRTKKEAEKNIEKHMKQFAEIKRKAGIK